MLLCTENMAERKRTFSPQYTPLLEEEEEEESEGGNSDSNSVLKPRHNHHYSRTSSQGKFEERVVILSDQGSKERGNGDADSGISLSEAVGDEHPTGKVSVVSSDHQESLLVLIVQIVIPFFFAGFGMMAAGLLLDAVQVSRRGRVGTCVCVCWTLCSRLRGHFPVT